MEHAIRVADVNPPIAHAGRCSDWAHFGALGRIGLVGPLQLATSQIKGVQVLVEGADVNGVAHDRGRALNAVFCFELPTDLQRVRKRCSSHPDLLRAATEKRPIFSRGGERGQSCHKEQES